MADIPASLVKELRQATNVSMMECKRALVDTDGDIDKATKLLREMGMAVAAKKSTRTANQGLIASASSDDNKTKSLVEINCETDFVAKNENFQGFVADFAGRAVNTDASLAEEAKDEIIAKIAEIGENIIASRNVRFILDGNGVITSYIHLGGKVGILLEVGCEKPETAENESFKELAKDLALHVAACNPACLTSDQLPADEVAAEREIFAKQVEGKPAEIVEKIVDGKLKKYFGEICFIEQGFVKEPKQSVSELLAEKGKELDDTLVIKRFERYQIGS